MKMESGNDREGWGGNICSEASEQVSPVVAGKTHVGTNVSKVCWPCPTTYGVGDFSEYVGVGVTLKRAPVLLDGSFFL